MLVTNQRQRQRPYFAGGTWFWGECPGFRKYTLKCSGVMGCRTVPCSLCKERGSAFSLQPFSAFVVFTLAARGLCCCTRAFSSCGEPGLLQLQCAGFSLWWLLLFQSLGSSTRASGVWACMLSLCGMQA